MDEEERDHLEELLRVYRRRLRSLEKQAAQFGARTDAQILSEIEDVRDEILRIKNELEGMSSAATSNTPVHSANSVPKDKLRHDEGSGVFEGISSYILKGYPDFTNAIRTATRISILGTSLSSSATHYFTNFESFLQRGGSLRIIVSDTIPEVLAMQTYRAASIKEPKQIEELIQSHITIVSKLVDKTAHPDDFQLKVMPYLPPYSITLIEQADGSAVAYVKLLTFQKTESEQPTFAFRRHLDQEWFDYFSDQFERIWHAPNRRLV